jgi:hypothetical protein
VVIDDKDQPLDDENLGFGGSAEGNSRTVTGCWCRRDFIIPFVSFGDTRGELLNVSGEGREICRWDGGGRGQDGGPKETG